MEKAVNPGNADGLWIDTAIRLPLFISYNHNCPSAALCAASNNFVSLLDPNPSSGSGPDNKLLNISDI